MEISLTMQEVNIIYEVLQLVEDEKDKLHLSPKTIAKYKHMKDRFEEYKS